MKRKKEFEANSWSQKSKSAINFYSKKKSDSKSTKKFIGSKNIETDFNRSSTNNELIYGLNSIKQCLLANKSFSKIYIDKNKIFDGEVNSLIKKSGVFVSRVPKDKLDALVKGNHQGIVGYTSPIKFISEDELIKFLNTQKTPFTLIILNGVTDVRNIGAIIRTAVCAGVAAVILDSSCGLINSETVHTSSGAIFEIKICKVRSIAHLINLLSDIKVEVIACSEKTENIIYGLDLNRSVAFLFGSEGGGIEKKHLDAAHKVVKIPMFGSVSSLNVSVATSIVVYESLRQRMTNH